MLHAYISKNAVLTGMLLSGFAMHGLAAGAGGSAKAGGEPVLNLPSSAYQDESAAGLDPDNSGRLIINTGNGDNGDEQSQDMSKLTPWGNSSATANRIISSKTAKPGDSIILPMDSVSETLNSSTGKR